MITPQEIENRKFEKSMRGYNVDEVDEFMKILAQDYEELYKENQTVKGKITVLVNKIEEYRRVEESLRNALLSAQQVGETVIRQANAEADLIMREAKVKADQHIADVKTQTEKERIALDGLKRDTANFRNKMVSLFKSQVDVLSGIEELSGIKNPIARTTMERYRPSSIPSVEPAYPESGGKVEEVLYDLEQERKSKAVQPPESVKETPPDTDKEKLKSLFFGFDSRDDDE